MRPDADADAARPSAAPGPAARPPWGGVSAPIGCQGVTRRLLAGREPEDRTPPPGPRRRTSRTPNLPGVARVLVERRDEILAGWIDRARSEPFRGLKPERALAIHIAPLLDALASALQRGGTAGSPARGVRPRGALRPRFPEGLTPGDVVIGVRLLRTEIGRALSAHLDPGTSLADLLAAEAALNGALDETIQAALAAADEAQGARRRAGETLEQSERLLRLLVDSLRAHAVFVLDPEGRVATWNAGAERIKGYAASEVLGQPYERFFPPEDVAEGKPRRLLERALAGGTAVDRGWRVRRDGSRFWADATLTAVRDPEGRLRGFAKVTRDATEQHRAEEARAAFLAALTHDVHNPLTAASGAAQLLRMRAARGAVPPAELAADLERVEAAVARAARRLDELADLTRLQLGEPLPLALRPVDLGELVLKTAAAYEQGARRHSVRVTAPADPIVGEWDRARLERVVENLVSNAVKYSPKGGVIDVSVARDDGWAVVAVRDRGIGIPPDDLPQIFERFARGGNVGDIPGSGVGLDVVRQIAEQHGGAVGVESGEGRGTTFTVRLPLDPGGAGAV
jgi:PAS domain S-box-containing protein